MTKEIHIDNKEVFNKIRSMSNKFRFRILELTQNKDISVTELGEKLKLAYTKTADYITMLENNRLVSKKKDGKRVLVKSNIKIVELFN